MQKTRILIATLILLGLVAACGPTGEEGTPGATAPIAAVTETPMVGTTAEMTATTTVPMTGTATSTVPMTTTAEMTATTTPGELPSTGGSPTATVGMTGTAELRTPEEAALEAAGGQEIGGSVSVLAQWGGSEQETFLSMVAPFEEATGIEVQYEGSRDANAILTTRLQGGNPPDLAGLPGPGQMREFAQAGSLVDLNEVLDTSTYGAQYAQTWSDLGTVDGQLVGIFMKASLKGLIWYNPKGWQANNWQPPTTWDELISLSQEMAATGVTPWCEALESSATSGWPGTDWLEDIVLRQSGIEVYDRWWQGELEWTSPEIRQAWEAWGQIVGDPNMVYGGANTMLTTNFGNVGDPLFTDPPGCYMAHQATFITDFFTDNTPGIQAGTDFDFFPVPSFDTQSGEATVAAGDLFGMFNDTPQARALINYLVTPEAQAIWVEAGGAISPNKGVPLTTYPDELSRKAAERLTGAETVAFDASDQMPDQMNTAFLRGILDFVQNPGNLDSILESLEATRQDAYQATDQ